MTNVEKPMNNANETAAVKLEPFIPMDKKDIIRAAIYGAFAGAILTVCREIEERRVGKECRSRWSPYH